MIEFEIDGKKIEAREGSTIIEAADQAGIYIPRFCYHEKLSIAANCRMCLVEVEKSPKALPACATPATPQMKVFTTSAKAVEAQRDVMEYLLINHPLDCPICDQGGECELQDLSMGFGKAFSYYKEGKRSVYDQNLGPLIETNMTRCIQCTRCVRFGEEVAGVKELGMVNRGEMERISTYVKHFMRSELSGNIIDLCPVGALTAKPSKYRIRGWELTEHPLISPHDCVGSNIFVHTKFKEYIPQRPIMRAVPRENEAINETWMCDRDRFSYESLYHRERITLPRIKLNGEWHELSWTEALGEAAHLIKNTIEEHNAEEIAALISPSATIEEMYLLEKILRGLGSDHIDYRIHQLDFSPATHAQPSLGMTLPEIENLSAILLVGSNVRQDQPLINHRINKAAQENVPVMVINSLDYEFNYALKQKIIEADLVTALAKVVKAAADKKQKTIAQLKDVHVDEAAKQFVEHLETCFEKMAIFLGPDALNHPQAGTIFKLVKLFSSLYPLRVGILSEGANAQGAFITNAKPIARGFNAKEMLVDKPRRLYILFNLELEFDSAYPEVALSALHNADAVICINTFVTKRMQYYAKIILPLAPFAETSGTYVNADGQWQSFQPASVPDGDSRPGWQILCVLGQLLHLDHFHFHTSTEIRDEIRKSVIQETQTFDNSGLKFLSSDQKIEIHQENSALIRFAPWHMYTVDPLVRRSEPLQKMLLPATYGININEKTAAAHQLKEGDRVTAVQKDSRISLPIFMSEQVPEGVVLIYSGLEETAGFGEAMKPIALEKESV